MTNFKRTGDCALLLYDGHARAVVKVHTGVTADGFEGGMMHVASKSCGTFLKKMRELVNDFLMTEWW